METSERNEADPVARIVTEHRRLDVLLLLDRMPGRCANDRVLGDCLAVRGFATPASQVRQDMQWLTDLGLIGLEAVDEVLVGRLTGTGEEALRGVSRVDGLRSPRPSE